MNRITDCMSQIQPLRSSLILIFCIEQTTYPSIPTGPGDAPGVLSVSPPASGEPPAAIWYMTTYSSAAQISTVSVGWSASLAVLGPTLDATVAKVVATR
ncbi:unnamed protein product [Pleuronectes platessa]|uniref:Uncharacterized protein n=1 Tax=Pleuronectes platessa TaxID=8262 RepID=A0A9N7V791_PLEPL|nr:unnamed protein product [Pleuronectes platessa]